MEPRLFASLGGIFDTDGFPQMTTSLLDSIGNLALVGVTDCLGSLGLEEVRICSRKDLPFGSKLIIVFNDMSMITRVVSASLVAQETLCLFDIRPEASTEFHGDQIFECLENHNVNVSLLNLERCVMIILHHLGNRVLVGDCERKLRIGHTIDHVASEFGDFEHIISNLHSSSLDAGAFTPSLGSHMGRQAKAISKGVAFGKDKITGT